jgi:ferritin
MVPSLKLGRSSHRFAPYRKETVVAIAKKVEEAMNAQFAFELKSAYTYLAMSAHCEFYSYIIDRGGRVEFEELGKPQAEYGSIVEIFTSSLENEQAVTQAINELYTLTTTEQDYASQAFLNWFVTEQVEEEKTVESIIDALNLIGGEGDALYMLDKDLGGRTPAA